MITTGTYILDDSVYVDYGGWTGSSTPTQRQFAYRIAENDVMSYLGTRLVPEYITGSYAFPPSDSTLSLGHSYVSQIAFVQFYGSSSTDTPVFISGSDLPANFATSPDYGYINSTALRYTIDKELCYISCAGSSLAGLHAPIRMEIVYRAGLPVGMGVQPNIVLALVMAASISLKEMVDPFALESGSGDAGVEQFSTDGYSETRKGLINTVFGNSPVANKIRRLLMSYHKRPAIRV